MYWLLAVKISEVLDSESKVLRWSIVIAAQWANITFYNHIIRTLYPNVESNQSYATYSQIVFLLHK